MRQLKAGHEAKQWADIVDLLSDYFEASELEFEGYRKIYGNNTDMRLIDMTDLCPNHVFPSTPATIDDYVSGAHKDINWSFALAALVVRHCEDV